LAQSLSSKIVRNTLFNIIGRFWQIFVLLLLAPYIIGHIGIERFGLWAIVGVFTSYLGLLDFGVGTGFVKFISEFYVKREFKKLNEVFNTGALYYLIFSVLIVVLVFFSIDWVLAFLNIPPDIYSDALFVIKTAVLIYLVLNILLMFKSILEGLQRMDVVNGIQIASSVPLVVGTIMFLEFGYGIRGLIINNLIVYLFITFLLIFFSLRVLPQIRFGSSYITGSMFKRLFAFGVHLQATKLSTLINFQMDHLILARFIGIGSVAFYQLGSRISWYTRSFPELLLSALTPAVAELQARDRFERIYELFLRASKYVVLAAISIMVFVALNASLIMHVWMGGSGFDKSALVVQILLFGYFFNIVFGVVSPVVLGIGRPEIRMKAALFSAVMNLVLSIGLVIRFGFLGAPFGTAIAMSVASFYYIIAFHKHMKKPVFPYFCKVFVIPLLAVLAAGSAAFAAKLYLGFSMAVVNRLTGIFILLADGIVFTAVFSLVIIFLRYLDELDRKLLAQYLPILFRGD
jgi:O-antigen/teichoic acid export membrane protein